MSAIAAVASTSAASCRIHRCTRSRATSASAAFRPKRDQTASSSRRRAGRVGAARAGRAGQSRRSFAPFEDDCARGASRSTAAASWAQTPRRAPAPAHARSDPENPRGGLRVRRLTNNWVAEARVRRRPVTRRCGYAWRALRRLRGVRSRWAPQADPRIYALVCEKLGVEPPRVGSSTISAATSSRRAGSGWRRSGRRSGSGAAGARRAARARPHFLTRLVRSAAAHAAGHEGLTIEMTRRWSVRSNRSGRRCLGGGVSSTFLVIARDTARPRRGSRRAASCSGRPRTGRRRSAPSRGVEHEGREKRTVGWRRARDLRQTLPSSPGCCGAFTTRASAKR